MSLFQSTVVSKYLKSQNNERIHTQWEAFKLFFHNPEIQENIRNSKEEQYQGEFLIDLFVNILGYTKNPTPNFNLTTEYKNIKDSKKADGAIIINDTVKAVIELKGTNTTDLSKIETQAFGYKNNQPDCSYVITSNFEKLRFYVDNAIEHIEFNLFQLTEKEFELLYLCLAYENMAKDIPKKLKDESIGQEDIITKQLYNDYSLFKRELHQSLVALNPEYDVLVLFKKSQKLIDRFLFLFFAEDRQLLPPNSVRMILDQWNQLRELDEDIPLYNRFKKYFGYLNTGFKGKQYDVYAYNGGLFKDDDILDNIIIDDAMLFKHTFKLSEYDFASEVDVNILGHIFENSLNELDEITAQLEGQEVDKTKTKRKKDGVFYTPKYITKYIVDNTVGKLCEEKKAELQLNEDDYTSDKKRTQANKKILLAKLTDYRDWLLQLTICDPACGSGAFLNQALDFLITEHRYIDELQAKLFGDAMVLSDVEKSILENNLFGVDINEESVEIAKLSLWLRTAQPNRKLNDLNNNIKCGNSLIDDPAVAGDKAFNWQQQFPKVFAKGGFDVVIGNPPYVQIQKLGIESERLNLIGFMSFERTGDLYALFYEQGFRILKENGFLSFITGSSWLRSNYGKSLRKFFIENTQLIQIIDFSDCKIFDDATVLTCIVTFKKKSVETQCVKSLRLTKKDQNIVKLINNYFITNHTDISNLDTSSWVISNKDEYEIKLKVKHQGVPLKNWNLEIFRGVLTGYNEAFIIDDITKNKLIKEHPSSQQLIKPILRGRDIGKYNISDNKLWLIGTFPSLNIKIDDFPAIKRHLQTFGKKLEQSGEIYKNEAGKSEKTRKKTSNKWFETQDTISYVDIFDKPKIIYPNMTKFFPFVLDKYNYYTNQKCYLLTGNYLEYLVCFFNSKLFKFCFEEYFPELQGNTRELNKVIFQELYIKTVSAEINERFKLKSEYIHTLNTELEFQKLSIINLLKSKFEKEIISIKIQNWFNIKYSEFLKELKNYKIDLSLSEEAEWMNYFNEQKQKALEIKTQIDNTDKQINQMVYELYGLTPEEIEIVENS